MPGPHTAPTFLWLGVLPAMETAGLFADARAHSLYGPASTPSLPASSFGKFNSAPSYVLELGLGQITVFFFSFHVHSFHRRQKLEGGSKQYFFWFV